MVRVRKQGLHSADSVLLHLAVIQGQLKQLRVLVTEQQRGGHALEQEFDAICILRKYVGQWLNEGVVLRFSDAVVLKTLRACNELQ